MKKATKKKKNRHLEYEDSPSVLERKCKQLASALKRSTCTVVYTGAGISTAASIPDYRGPNGVWTSAKKGFSNHVRHCDPVQSCPTQSHMALNELYRCGYIQHVLSQNCDGLHLRSGLPQKSLSEIHGNMHIEVCKKCNPMRQYVRPFDVTEKTAFRRHKTVRQCTVCFSVLYDTIVHFGEYGKIQWPLNWQGILEVLHKQNCQMILCLGSSLQILHKYQNLWCEDRDKHSRPKLYIVNLQWTPKDRTATLKINGKCDAVMKRIMELLGLEIPSYCRVCDSVLNSRHRNTRNKELMNQLTNCKCHFSSSPGASTSKSGEAEVVVGRSEETKIPGWWKVGLHFLSSSKRSRSLSQLSAEAEPVTSPKTAPEKIVEKRGRPRKRKNSTDSAFNDVQFGPKRKRGRPRKTSLEVDEKGERSVRADRPTSKEAETDGDVGTFENETVSNKTDIMETVSEPSWFAAGHSSTVPGEDLSICGTSVSCMPGSSFSASINHPFQETIQNIVADLCETVTTSCSCSLLENHSSKRPIQNVGVCETAATSTTVSPSRLRSDAFVDQQKDFTNQSASFEAKDWFDSSDSRKSHSSFLLFPPYLS